MGREIFGEARGVEPDGVRVADQVIELERVPLTAVADAWERQRRADSGAKLVLIPKGDT